MFIYFGATYVLPPRFELPYFRRMTINYNVQQHSSANWKYLVDMKQNIQHFQHMLRRWNPVHLNNASFKHLFLFCSFYWIETQHHNRTVSSCLWVWNKERHLLHRWKVLDRIADTSSVIALTRSSENLTSDAWCRSNEIQTRPTFLVHTPMIWKPYVTLFLSYSNHKLGCPCCSPACPAGWQRYRNLLRLWGEKCMFLNV